MFVRTIRAAIFSLVGGGLLAFSGCASGQVAEPSTSLQTQDIAPATVAAPVAPPVAQPVVPPVAPPAAEVSGPAPQQSAAADVNAYHLDNGDEIKVTVYDEPDLSGTFELDGSGAFSMSLIGQVEARNLTARQLEREIERKLRDGFLRNPSVTVEVMTYRPFYILGEINRPGQYPYTNGLTVMNAIASAGDFTYRADKRRVFIKSVDQEHEREVSLTPSTPVRPGDTIRIKQRLF
ncbi:MAG: polysaccharide biosynthesis/export family protein [Hyphomonadaceae bacterium]